MNAAGGNMTRAAALESLRVPLLADREKTYGRRATVMNETSPHFHSIQSDSLHPRSQARRNSPTTPFPWKSASGVP